MSKADKMFEELGYNKEYGRIEFFNDDYISFEYKDDYDYNYILFSLKDKTIKTQCYHELSVKEHLAIHEKMKELGWLNEKI